MHDRSPKTSGVSLGGVTTLLLASRKISVGLALVNSIILARVLGPESLGHYAYAVGLAAVFGLLPNMGINTVVMRAVARDPDAATGLVPAALRAQLLLAAGVFVLVPALSVTLPEQPVPLRFVVLAAAKLGIGALSLPYLGVLSAHARYDRLAAAELVTAASGTALLVAAALVAGNVEAFLWAHVLAAVVATAVARRTARPLLPPPASDGERAPVSEVLRKAFPFGATAGLQGLYTRLDIILLGQMAAPVALGAYNVAYKPTNLIVAFGATVAGALFPVLARPHATAPPESFHNVTRILAVVAPAMALALGGLAGPLLGILYGNAYVGAAPILAALAWSATAHWLYAPSGVLLQARGRERAWLFAIAVAVLVNASLNLWAIPRWGALGAAGATVTSEVLLLIVALVLVARWFDFSPSFRAVAVGASAAAAGVAVLWGLRDSGALTATAAALAAYVVPLTAFRLFTPSDAALVAGWLRQALPGSARG